MDMFASADFHLHETGLKCHAADYGTPSRPCGTLSFCLPADAMAFCSIFDLTAADCDAIIEAAAELKRMMEGAGDEQPPAIAADAELATVGAASEGGA
jgi:hypothetical protein